MTMKKFPRIKNLPWSDSNSSDDVWLSSATHFRGKRVVVTSKMDGENTTMGRGYCHARSVDSVHSHHPSRSYVKGLHGKIQQMIRNGWRIVGENLYAKHSIYYPGLSAYFMVFGIFDPLGNYIGWDDVVKRCRKLGLQTVPVLYDGLWDESKVRHLWPHSLFDEVEAEGYVVRLASPFHETQFDSCIAKYVRKNHCQTNVHWMHSALIPNGIVPKAPEQGRV
jgi:hypothetical protein